MTDYTADEVLSALAATFPSDDRLYEEIGWELYENTNDRAEHIKQYLEGEYAEPEDLLDWSELAYDLRSSKDSISLRGEPVEITCVQQLGGMDKGTNANVTFKVGDQFFTKEGWYQSHYGYEYDGDFYESFPTEKITYTYRRKP